MSMVLSSFEFIVNCCLTVTADDVWISDLTSSACTSHEIDNFYHALFIVKNSLLKFCRMRDAIEDLVTNYVSVGRIFDLFSIFF